MVTINTQSIAYYIIILLTKLSNKLQIRVLKIKFRSQDSWRYVRKSVLTRRGTCRAQWVRRLHQMNT